MNEPAETIVETLPAVNFSESDLKRFWSRVDKNGTIPAHRPELGKCWVWTGGKIEGYGAFWFNGRNHFAHRISFKIAGNSLPDDLCACHHCDNRPCVNPSHIFPGTAQDNAIDRENKGRGNKAFGERNGSRTHPERFPKGENHCFSKLTDIQVIEIRRRKAAGGITQTALAKQYGVDQSAISEIVNRKTWKHI